MYVLNIPYTLIFSRSGPVPSIHYTISSITNYEDMTKEELLQELMKAKIREARLKKGYIVKGVGQTKEYILLSSKNTK